MNRQVETINLLNPVDSQDVTEFYVDDMLNNPSLIRNSAQVDFNDKNLDNVRFVKVNKLPAVREHLTPNLYVYPSIAEPTLRNKDQNNDFNNYSSNNIPHITLISEPTDANHVKTKSYAVSVSENEKDVICL